jgi:hypothetical protein
MDTDLLLPSQPDDTIQPKPAVPVLPSPSVDVPYKRLMISGDARFERICANPVENKLNEITDLHLFYMSRIPDNLHSLFPNLISLNILGGEFSQLPDTLNLLDKLTWLYISGCNNLISIPNSICYMLTLKELLIQNCDLISELPFEIGIHNKNLTHICLELENLKSLPDSILLLPLQLLRIWCNEIPQLRDNFNSLKNTSCNFELITNPSTQAL